MIEPLSEEDGGGFLATVAELPGCMSDGETRAEALANVEDAIAT
jgi:antitoxin HicB